jgi:hypothetical protein
MSVFSKIQNCEYIPDLSLPVRTDPDFDAKAAAFAAEEAVGLEMLKADLLAEHGLTGDRRACLAFEIAQAREGYLGLPAVVALFEDLLPLVRDVQ